MDILLGSVLCSMNSIHIIREELFQDISGQTDQKYYRLIAKGLSANASVTCISSIPVRQCSKLVYRLKGDNEGNVSFKYARSSSIIPLRHALIFFDTFFTTLNWAIATPRKDRFVICDALNVTQCSALLLARLFGIKVVGILTDMPELMVCRGSSIRHRIINSITRFISHQFSYYVFITEAMNSIVNHNRKPYIVMEGLVDADMNLKRNHRDPYHKQVLYAGGLYEEYGVKTLIEAFSKVTGDDLQLILYGTGPMESSITQYISNDKRIEYRGSRPNAEIVQSELSATLLVNPRPSHEEFVKYSFPSKNMEYMASGTPILTTNLPGMPKEYHQFVYIAMNENTEGMATTLDTLLNHTPIEELEEKGRKAKEYVMSTKNNILQSRRIINLFLQNQSK